MKPRITYVSFGYFEIQILNLVIAYEDYDMNPIVILNRNRFLVNEIFRSKINIIIRQDKWTITFCWACANFELCERLSYCTKAQHSIVHVSVLDLIIDYLIRLSRCTEHLTPAFAPQHFKITLPVYTYVYYQCERANLGNIINNEACSGSLSLIYAHVLDI